MWLKLSKNAPSPWCSGFLWLVVLFGEGCVNIEAVSTARFNANIREFADSSDATNTSHLNTLQKQKRISQNDRISNKDFDPITFKDAPDNAVSSSSQGRGYQFFPHNDFTGHGFSGYEGDYNKGPVIEHFYPEQEYHEPHYVDHGRPHSHHDHHQGIAVKSFLIPLAGVALLGVAAALVTNPVLLQLGVVSGRRRRRREAPLPAAPPAPEPRTRVPGTWNGATPLPYRESADAATVRQPYAFTTPRYAGSTLQRAWLAEVSERPELENGADILKRAVRKYGSVPERRGKGL